MGFVCMPGSGSWTQVTIEPNLLGDADVAKQSNAKKMSGEKDKALTRCGLPFLLGGKRGHGPTRRGASGDGMVYLGKTDRGQGQTRDQRRMNREVAQQERL